MENRFVKIKQLGDRSTFGVLSGTVEVTEKIDGANYSWKVNPDGSLMFRSHNVVLGGGMEFGSQWNPATTMIREIHAKTPFKKGYIYFGECLVKPHRINYGAGITPFIGFAILNEKFNLYIKNWKEEYEAYGIPTVPVMYLPNPTVTEILALVDGSSWLVPSVEREGIVIKNYADQKFAKIVCDKFKEVAKIKKKPINEEHTVLDETPSVVEKYCTDARVLKKANEYCDETGSEMEMAIMRYLPRIVYEDILNEEILNIAAQFGVVDFNSFHKLVASTCAIILKAHLLNGAK